MSRNRAHTLLYFCCVQFKKVWNMQKSLLLSPRVLSSIKNLPSSDREAISRAFTCEFILQDDPSSLLTPFQSIIYTMIRFYVMRDNPDIKTA